MPKWAIRYTQPRVFSCQSIMPLLIGWMRPHHAGPNAAGMRKPQAFPLTSNEHH